LRLSDFARKLMHRTNIRSSVQTKRNICHRLHIHVQSYTILTSQYIHAPRENESHFFHIDNFFFVRESAGSAQSNPEYFCSTGWCIRGGRTRGGFVYTQPHEPIQSCRHT
jgi:hypothetical protein